MEHNDKQPTTFSKVPHEFVVKRWTNSVFFLKATLVKTQKSHVLQYLRNELGVSKQTADDIMGKMELSTGFNIRETNASYQILTTAHMFDNFYSATVKPTMNQLNNWFDVEVVCQHYERYMSAEYPDLYNDPTDDPREYAAATIEKFDSSKDLMLLRVPKAALYSDDKGTVCQERHRSIPLCPTSPPPPSEVIMLAWPPLRRDSPLVGRVISASRVYGQITQDLRKGYNMGMFELDITGDDGCSGAPILNHDGRLHCVYHGRLNSVGYGITAGEVRQFCGFGPVIQLLPQP